MKIKYTHIDPKYAMLFRNPSAKKEHCCDKMLEYLETQDIYFNSDRDNKPLCCYITYPNGKPRSIEVGVCLEQSTVLSHIEECPFCGEKIEFIKEKWRKYYVINKM